MLRKSKPLNESQQIPTEYALFDHNHNPFYPATTIRYALPKASRVGLTVYNTLGAAIASLRNEDQDAGYHLVVWDGCDRSGNPVGEREFILRIEAEAADGSERFISGRKFFLFH